MSERRFSRATGPVALQGVRSADVLGLVSRPQAFGVKRLIAGDLSRGSWRLHQLMSELFAQLELSEPSFAPEPLTDGLRRSEFARRADSETAGDRPTLETLHLVQRLLAALQEGPSTAIVVLLPHRGAVVERHDTIAIALVAQAVAPTRHRFVVVATEAGEGPALPDAWRVTWSTPDRGAPADDTPRAGVLALVPGILRPAELAFLAPSGAPAGATLALAGGCLLIDPSARGDRTEERYDELAASAGAAGARWLAAHAQCLGSDAALEPWTLFAHAGELFTAGGCELPLSMLARAREGFDERPGRAALVELLSQAVRVFHGRFEHAAATQDPDPRAPAPLRALLLHTKGWGLTMSNRAADARVHLDAARALLDGDGDGESDEHLSLLNIAALNRLQLGDWDEAYALEQRIRRALDRRATGSWQLRYVNCLNIARLHRRRGDLDAARRCCDEAFATVAGLRSDSDAVHENVLRARIEEARGDGAAAFGAWVRASLHWVACDAPEAIAARVTAAVGANKQAGAHDNVPDAASAALLARLREHARGRDADALEDDAGDSVPVFARPAAVSPAALPPQSWVPVLGDGWGVICGDADVTPALVSDELRRLRSALGALVWAARVDLRAPPPSCVIVDDRLGHEIPRTEAELVECCLRLGGGLPADAARALTERLRVRLATAVADLAVRDHGTVVSYKRYREPVALDAPSSAALSMLGDEPTIAELRRRLGPGIDVLVLLRGLERDRIVELRMPPSGQPGRFAGAASPS